MLRFASSPTGDMHIGDLRVALFNYLVSKQRKEDLIVRIEDIEKEKVIEGKDKEILEILEVFGIEYSQLIYQSESIRFHSAMALQLIHDKKAFSCFCSDNWLENKRKEAEDANSTYLYDDACKDLHPELVIDNINPFTIRINRPTSPIVIKDTIKGDATFENETLDSFVLLNHNKIPVQTFASAVDDMLNNISIVLRDEKFYSNSPKQEHVREMLNYDKKIVYAHLPSVLDLETVSVKKLLEDGFLPDAIANYLISLGNKTPKEIFNLKEAIEWLDFKNLDASPASFDFDKLKELNRKHLQNLDAKELSRYVGFADNSIGNLAKVYLNNVSTTKELREKIAPIFAPKEIASEYKEVTNILKEIIKNAPYFEEYKEFKNYLIKESGLDEKTMIHSLSLLLTGVEDGPEIADIYKYLKDYIGVIVK